MVRSLAMLMVPAVSGGALLAGDAVAARREQARHVGDELQGSRRGRWNHSRWYHGRPIAHSHANPFAAYKGNP